MLKLRLTKGRPLIKKNLQCCLQSRAFGGLPGDIVPNQSILISSQKRVQASESSLKSELCSISDALGVALTFCKPVSLIAETGRLTWGL